LVFGRLSATNSSFRAGRNRYPLSRRTDLLPPRPEAPVQPFRHASRTQDRAPQPLNVANLPYAAIAVRHAFEF
jgi:hypothetical protein